MAKKNKSGCGFIVGPVLILIAMVALWKNETRFDYHHAAKKTTPVSSLSVAKPADLISWTGAMDQNLTLEGHYVEDFTGHLVVYRRAEIYCWDRDEDEDGDVTWDLDWQGGVQSNARNTHVTQELRGDTILPPSYEVGGLTLQSERIEFVDPTESIPIAQLSLSGQEPRLETRENTFYLSKGQPDRLGDERLSYTAIPVPSPATWFGHYTGTQGVADTTHQRSGLLNEMIQDTGILHHLVAGTRPEALASMKKHIQRLKWIIRVVGTVAVWFGFLALFAGLLKFLFHIPVIGRMASRGAFLLSFVVGIPVAMFTIIAGFIAGHPVLLFVLLFLALLVVGIGLVVARRGKRTQQALKSQLEAQHGHALESDEMKELEYMELAQLAGAEQGIGAQEEEFLNSWGAKHGWDTEKQQSMLARAKETQPEQSSDRGRSHLENLIRLAIADGELTPFEMRSIQTAAANADFDAAAVRTLMAEVRQQAKEQAQRMKAS